MEAHKIKPFNDWLDSISSEDSGLRLSKLNSILLVKVGVKLKINILY